MPSTHPILPSKFTCSSGSKPALQERSLSPLAGWTVADTLWPADREGAGTLSGSHRDQAEAISIHGAKPFCQRLHLTRPPRQLYGPESPHPHLGIIFQRELFFGLFARCTSRRHFIKNTGAPHPHLGIIFQRELFFGVGTLE